MRSVRTFLLYSLAISLVSARASRYGHQAHQGGRVRKIIVVREPERHVEVRHEVRHVVRRRPSPVVVTEECYHCDDHYHGHQGSVSVVHEVVQPDVVVVDHGGPAYLQPQPAITHTHPVVQAAPVAPVAAVAPVAPVYQNTRPSAIDP